MTSYSDPADEITGDEDIIRMSDVLERIDKISPWGVFDKRNPDSEELVKSPIHPYFREGDVKYSEVSWTKGFGNTHGVPAIPLEVRNEHRKFWGFKPLKK